MRRSRERYALVMRAWALTLIALVGCNPSPEAPFAADANIDASACSAGELDCRKVSACGGTCTVCRSCVDGAWGPENGDDCHFGPCDNDSGDVDATPEVAVEGPAQRFELVHASPDFGPAMFCLEAFSSTADVTTASPLASYGPIGTRGETTAGAPLTYGDTSAVPLTTELIAALKVFQVVVFTVPDDPTARGSSCAAEWGTARSDPARWRLVAPATVKPDSHAFLGPTGCRTPTSECGGPAEISLTVLPGLAPSSSLRLLHWSRAPELQGIFASVMGATTTWSMGSVKMAFGSTAESIVDTKQLDTSRLILSPTTAVCTTSTGSPTTDCPAWSPQLASIASYSPWLKPGDTTSRVLVLFGTAASPRAVWIASQ